MATPETLRQDLTRTGYSQEEDYFYRLNRELIERRREELDRGRREMAERQAGAGHWLKCPKCGGGMEESLLSGIHVERCAQCSGVFFDAGELQTLLTTREPGRFLKLMERLSSRDREATPSLF